MPKFLSDNICANYLGSFRFRIGAAKRQSVDQETRLRKLDARQRRVLMLFESQPFITTKQIAAHLGIHRRTALNICNSLVKSGFLIQYGQARKSRKYGLESDIR